MRRSLSVSLCVFIARWRPQFYSSIDGARASLPPASRAHACTLGVGASRADCEPGRAPTSTGFSAPLFHLALRVVAVLVVLERSGDGLEGVGAVGIFHHVLQIEILD